MGKYSKSERERRLLRFQKAKAAFKSPFKATKKDMIEVQGKKSRDYKPYNDKPLSYFINTNPELKIVRSRPVSKGVRSTSLGEQLVADWLVKNNIRFKREKEFVDLVNPMTGKRLIIDFYLHAHKVVIEFDGRQHYKASKVGR